MTILFIDNDLEDLDLYKEAIHHINASEYFADRDMNINCLTLTECRNVISYIVNLPAKPDIIFLDINMPIMGRQRVFANAQRVRRAFKDSGCNALYKLSA